jgi:hypothetical protein
MQCIGIMDVHSAAIALAYGVTFVMPNAPNFLTTVRACGYKEAIMEKAAAEWSPECLRCAGSWGRCVTHAIVGEQHHGENEQEEKMQTKNTWWMIMIGGMLGVLLWAGPVGAQSFPGGLPACVPKLNTCTTSTAYRNYRASLARGKSLFLRAISFW